MNNKYRHFKYINYGFNKNEIKYKCKIRFIKNNKINKILFGIVKFPTMTTLFQRIRM